MCFQRLRPGHSDQIADPAAVLVLARAAVPVVVLVGHSRCADMRRNVALIVAQPPAQTLAIDQQLIELTAQRSLHIVTHEVLVWLAFRSEEHTSELQSRENLV